MESDGGSSRQHDTVAMAPYCPDGLEDVGYAEGGSCTGHASPSEPHVIPGGPQSVSAVCLCPPISFLSFCCFSFLFERTKEEEKKSSGEGVTTVEKQTTRMADLVGQAAHPRGLTQRTKKSTIRQPQRTTKQKNSKKAQPPVRQSRGGRGKGNAQPRDGL